MCVREFFGESIVAGVGGLLIYISIHGPLAGSFPPADRVCVVRDGGRLIFDQRTLCCVVYILRFSASASGLIEAGLCTDLWSSRRHFIFYSCEGIPYQNKMEGIVDTEIVPAAEKLESISIEKMGFRPPKSKAFNVSSKEDGPCIWSLTEEEQVCNLKENWKKAFTSIFTCMPRKFEINYISWLDYMVFSDSKIVENPWFVKVVAQLQINSCLEFCELEIDKDLSRKFVPGWKMTSLDLAILMGDLNMVQKILEISSLPETIIKGSLIDFRMLPKDFYFINLGDRKKISYLYTPLHLAIVGGNYHIVHVLLEKGASINASNWLCQTPLDLACKSGSLDLLLKLLENDNEKKTPLHIAIRFGDLDFLKKLPPQSVNAVDYKNSTPLHFLASSPFYNSQLTNIVKYLAEDKALDVKALDDRGISTFYLAVLCCNTELVIVLLDSFKDQLRLNEVCIKERGPPIQIAFEGGAPFEDIQSALMECDPIKGYMDKLYRDRQVYVDAANAILVGAALIASVTFASWLQPPLNYTSYSKEGYSSIVPASSTSNLNYVDVQHNIVLRAFWIFNALSFYFAIGTVVFGARSVLPRKHLFIKKTIEKLHTNLLVTSILLACSVLFVIIAFAIAGTIVLTPLLKYQWYMIVPTIVGGVVCLISLGFLVKSMVENYFVISIYSNAMILKQIDRDYLENLGYLT